MKRNVGYMLLAGGAGRRLGNVNKMLLHYQDQTFGAHIQKELEQTERSCFLSVANYECEAPTSWRIVRDRRLDADGRFAGPMAGILSCLIEARDQGLGGLFVVSCDMPLFQRALFDKMEVELAEHDIVLWKTTDGRVHYVCGYYSVRNIEKIQELFDQEIYRLRDLIDPQKTKILLTEEYGISDDCFLNINDMEQYRKLNER